MDSTEMKRLIAHYLRYDLGCPILATETASSLNTSFNDGGSADLLAVNKRGYLIEVEVKISLADLRADRKKSKHEYFRKLIGLPYKNTQMRFGQEVAREPSIYPTHFFYFAVPFEISNESKLICDELYPYAGLLSNQRDWYGNVFSRKEPKRLNPSKISLLQATRLAKAQSATIVRLMDEMANLKNYLPAPIHGNEDMR